MYSMPRRVRRPSSKADQERITAGQRLRELRLKQGLSQLGLARNVGLDVYTIISQLENGRGSIPSGQYRIWADALAVEPRELTQLLAPLLDGGDPADRDVLRQPLTPRRDVSGRRTTRPSEAD